MVKLTNQKLNVSSNEKSNLNWPFRDDIDQWISIKDQLNIKMQTDKASREVAHHFMGRNGIHLKISLKTDQLNRNINF